MHKSTFLPSRLGFYRKAFTVAMGTSLVLAGCGGGGQEVDSASAPMGAASAAASGSKVGRSDFSKNSATLRTVRLCDLSGCYMAWNVVDSDGDGVCDADEIMAGTDPFDRSSKPTLQVVAELSGKGRLPSFEAASGVFAVYPAEMQTKLQEYYKGKGAIEQAFAFPLGRERGDSLSRVGIKADQLKDFGLDPEHDGFTIGLDRPKDSGLPGRRVGGVDVSLISADKEHVEYIFPQKGSEPPTYDQYGDKHTKLVNGDDLIEFKNGSKAVVSPEGETKHVCPPPMVDPDSDTGSGATEPTAEQKQSFERLRGAVELTLAGWLAPEVSGEPPKDKKPFIMLVDPEFQGSSLAVLLTPSKLATAQPEVNPNLPRPDVPAGTPSGKGGCTVGCDR